MSRYTHVNASFYVDILERKSVPKKFIEETLKDFPVICGSEQDAHIFVNILPGYNTYINLDCENCKYKDTIKILEDGKFLCGSEEDFECSEGKYQTHATINIIGDLRDRSFDVIITQMNEFIENLQEKFEIINACCVVKDDWEGCFDLEFSYDKDLARWRQR